MNDDAAHKLLHHTRTQMDPNNVDRSYRSYITAARTHTQFDLIDNDNDNDNLGANDQTSIVVD